MDRIDAAADGGDRERNRIVFSEARVPTVKASVYMKQLSAHFGHRLETEATDERGMIRFAFGVCEMRAEPEALDLTVRADDHAALARMEGVVASHLVRFGFRDELQVNWSRRTERGTPMVRISVQIEGAQGLTWAAWQTLVREVEAMGFAGLY